jgi:hypothetical protein
MILNNQTGSGNHLLLADTLNNMGGVYRSQDKALDMYKVAFRDEKAKTLELLITFQETSFIMPFVPPSF